MEKRSSGTLLAVISVIHLQPVAVCTVSTGETMNLKNL